MKSLAKEIWGYGLIQPLRRIAGDDFLAANSDGMIRAEIRQLLGTKPGELRWDPEFGMALDQYRHRSGTEGLADLAADDIVEGIHQFIPSVADVVIDVAIDIDVLKIRGSYQAIAKNSAASNVSLGPSIIEEEF